MIIGMNITSLPGIIQLTKEIATSVSDGVWKLTLRAKSEDPIYDGEAIIIIDSETGLNKALQSLICTAANMPASIDIKCEKIAPA